MSKINLDSTKLQYHPERVAKWMKKETVPPLYVEIGNTSACNYRCVYCALDFTEYKNKFIGKETMLSALKDMGGYGVKSCMWAGEGEVLLDKNLPLYVETAKKSGMDVAITTNGLLLTKEKADEIIPNLTWIRISMASIYKENYAKIHGTHKENFERVIRNIQVATKQGYKIDVQFLLLPQNVDEVVEFVRIMSIIGVNSVQIKPYSQHPDSTNKIDMNYSKFLVLKEKLSKFERNDFKIYFRDESMKRLEKEKVFTECHGLDFFALITSEGYIIPCNLFYRKKEFYYGNLYDASFKEIWESKKRQEVVAKIRAQGIDGCREICRLESVNRFLHRVKNLEEYDNFL